MFGEAAITRIFESSGTPVLAQQRRGAGNDKRRSPKELRVLSSSLNGPAWGQAGTLMSNNLTVSLLTEKTADYHGLPPPCPTTGKEAASIKTWATFRGETLNKGIAKPQRLLEQKQPPRSLPARHSARIEYSAAFESHQAEKHGAALKEEQSTNTTETFTAGVQEVLLIIKLKPFIEHSTTRPGSSRQQENITSPRQTPFSLFFIITHQPCCY